MKEDLAVKDSIIDLLNNRYNKKQVTCGVIEVLVLDYYENLNNKEE